MYDDYNYDEAPEDYEPSEPPLDIYFKNAQDEIRELYEGNKEGIYYIRQLQVRFEKKYFHWVTNNAILGLLKLGYLKDIRIPRETGTSTRYFTHRSNRYPVRDMNEIEEVVQAYSQDNITRSCGHRAEDLFCKALALRGFMPMKSKVKEYYGKKWIKTGHDLDFVFSRDNIDYGCEIKNTLGYIEKDELEIKLEMCSFLELRPLFIMRYSPKTYNNLIIENGGFALIFVSQIYELSQDTLVKRIQDIVGMPVICPTSIPDGIIDRLENWHMKKIK
jgi:hypothetical protein